MKRKIKRKRTSNTGKSLNKKRLYEALMSIYNFYHVEDILSLKSPDFLDICEIQDIDWNFKKLFLQKEFLNQPEKRNWPFQFSCSLDFESSHYGELIFSSSQKFSQSQKSFLKKVAIFISSSLYFLESKDKMKNIKQHWGDAFDSFSQAFCITDKNLKILRANQSFQKMSGIEKSELSSKNLFELFRISAPIPQREEQEGSWLIRGEKEGRDLCWEISFKPLFLKKEKTQALLFLIKDVTEEMEIEQKLSTQTKEREIGLIKGSIAHELNNPIAGIKTLLTVVEKQVSPRKALIKETLQEMQKAIDRCHQIIRHLLFISQNSLEVRNKTPIPSKTR